jgi:crossover junction endodeoxyribonuclease RusA
MNTIEIVLPMPPSANRYWVTFAYISMNSRNPGKPMANTVPSTEAKEYKNEVRTLCIRNKVKRLHGAIEMDVKVYRPMRRGDLDNRLKVLIDSLRELAYDDDDQIVKITAERFEDKHNPRVVVTLTERVEAQTEAFTIIK